MPPTDPSAALASLLSLLMAARRGRRAGVVRQILLLLADARVPPPIRISAAARVLRFIPDKPRPVRQVVRALTVDLSPSRALDLLRQLQHHLEKSSALDELIEARERRVRLVCPRCRVRLARVEMIKHLWHEHGLALNRGKTRAAERIATEFQAAHASTGNTEPLDCVAELTGVAGLRRWLAEDELPAEEVAPLLGSAAGHGAGLCPGCFAEVPAAVTPLPPALVLANGRLAGDGYSVGIGGNAWIRTLAVAVPAQPRADSHRTLAPRFAGTLAASFVLAIALFLAPTPRFMFMGLAIAALAYLVVGLPRPGRTSDDAIIDAAWERLAPNLVEREEAARFLTRLCLVSMDRGNPDKRVRILAMVASRAALRADESDAELQLLAAAWVLQVLDVARFGRDVVAGIATFAAMGFSGERSSDFAEFVVAAYLTRERNPGDLARLRILLIGAAFEAGLVPRDLLDLWAGAPNLKRVMAVEPTHRLGLLFGLWRTREGHAWHSVGHGDTVFDLARRRPRTAQGLLARFPDLLLLHRPERGIEDLIGPVLVCARGVAIGEHLTADPDVEVQLANGGRELIFGRHRIEAPGKLPEDFPEVVRRWLRFRADVLVPFIDGYLSPGADAITRRVLGPFCRQCKACGMISAMGCGFIGRATSLSDGISRE
jgi:uncharacterized C2H2 Zn-finger protein